MRFLIVENDRAQAELIKKALLDKGYVVDVVLDGEQGWAYVEAFSYDLLLVNASLPRLNGITLCQRIRERGYIVPILLLTTEDSDIDQLTCLNARADDLLVRPSTRRELFARIKALLNSPGKANAFPVQWQGISLDPTSRKVTYQNQPLSLSTKEYNLLELFLRNPKRVLTQTAILEHLWSFESQPNDNTVRAHIKRLRKKLKTVNADQLIETVYGAGYRLKPLADSPSASLDLQSSSAQTPNLGSQNLSVPSTAEPPKTIEQVNSWERLKSQVVERIEVLEQTIATAQSSTLTPQLSEAGETQAHKLAGVLGILGLKSEYRLAQQIEQWFIETRQAPEGSTSIAALQVLMEQLRQDLQQFLTSQQETTPSLYDSILISEQQTLTSQQVQYQVLVVDDDVEVIRQLQQVALNWNIQLNVTATLEQARVIIQETPPDLVLLDLVFPDIENGGLIFLEELKEQFLGLPILVWSARDQISDRAAVSRLGGKAFLSKSVPCDQVLEAIKDILQGTPTTSAKILAVDDDAMTLNFLQELLPSYSLEVTPLDDPRLFWQTLEQIVPDLVILDWDMPHFNGLELCQMVRADQIWNTLPIVFLSARQDAQVIQEMYQAGADDYIYKPFAEGELITRIFNRLERIHLLRSLAETDPITGLANRRRSTQDLNRYLYLSQRHHQSFCLVLITLDHFQSICNQYGYRVGDNVMRQLGQILQQYFRNEDIISHWGGETFLVGLYTSNQVDGQKRIAHLLNLIENTVFPVNSYVQLQIAASAGISTYPKDGTDLSSLYTAAHVALYRAKAAGGNCCLTTAY